MHLCLFEDDRADALFPLTRTRATYDLRLGLRTILETTREAFGSPPTVLHARPLIAPVTAEEHDLPAGHLPDDDPDVLFVNGRFVADGGPITQRLRQACRPDAEARLFTTSEDGCSTLVAAWVPNVGQIVDDGFMSEAALTPAAFADLPEEPLEEAPLLGRLTDLLDALEPAIRRDLRFQPDRQPPFDHSGTGVQEGAHLVGNEHLHLAPDATIRPGAVINATDGPVYIGREALVMENAVVRGPAVIGARSQVKPGAHIEESVLGFYCRAGGEVEGSVLHSLSNKAHDGYLGDSYLGRWCNLGAGTITSNLKNDYGEVSVWSGRSGTLEDSGRQFAGLFMGDHAKCGIGTIFNTGTVVDVFCNLFDTGFPPRYLPPFSWGRPQGDLEPYRLEKALRVAETVMARRNRSLSEAQRALLTAIAEKGQPVGER